MRSQDIDLRGHLTRRATGLMRLPGSDFDGTIDRRRLSNFRLSAAQFTHFTRSPQLLGEIADALGIHPTTARTRLFRARRAGCCWRHAERDDR